MRIAVSGTHGSGKSTLIAGFAEKHPEYLVLGDPDELAGEGAGVDSFVAQLSVVARRLSRLGSGSDAVLERCPLDFVAYLEAWRRLGRPGDASAVIPDAFEQAAAAMESVDLLVLLPLTDGIRLPADEDLELREEMDGVLLELAYDADLVPERTSVLEIPGSASVQLARLEEAVAAQGLR